MKEFLVQTYTVALPIVLTALMGYIVWLLKNQKKDRSANSKGTMLLLRVQLIEYHDKYTTLGEIPSYAYENFMEMYQAYHELGGNGMVTKMKQEIANERMLFSMKNIDWKRKLTSRKFWAAVVGFVTPTMLAFGVSDSVVTQVAGIIMAGATCIAYIIGEGLVDSNRTDNTESEDENNG